MPENYLEYMAYRKDDITYWREYKKDNTGYYSWTGRWIT